LGLIRHCPRNCERRADVLHATGSDFREGWTEAMIRESGDLPRQIERPWAGCPDGALAILSAFGREERRAASPRPRSQLVVPRAMTRAMISSATDFNSLCREFRCAAHASRTESTDQIGWPVQRDVCMLAASITPVTL
jgi:hypothetical protein